MAKSTITNDAEYMIAVISLSLTLSTLPSSDKAAALRLVTSIAEYIGKMAEAEGRAMAARDAL